MHGRASRLCAVLSLVLHSFFLGVGGVTVYATVVEILHRTEDYLQLVPLVSVMPMSAVACS